jgi:F-type H+-transporting ATPase subunit delta
LKTHPLARRYARALFELASAAGKTGEVLAELQTFAAVLQEQRRIKVYLFSFKVDKKQKALVVEQLLQGKTSPLFTHFVLLLMQKGREAYYSQIVEAYGHLYDQSIGRVRAQVISAVPLQEKQVEQVRQQVGRYLKAEVILENKIDADILGGVIIKFAGVVIDGSLRHQLNKMRQELRQVKYGAAV